MSSSAPQAQNSAASVMSMTISVGREERDLAAKQAEAGIDVAGEDLEETVDDAGATHGSLAFRERSAEASGSGFGLSTAQASEPLFGARRDVQFEQSAARGTGGVSPPRQPALVRASVCSGVTVRHRSSSAASGSAFSDAGDDAEAVSSPRRSSIAQAATATNDHATPMIMQPTALACCSRSSVEHPRRWRVGSRGRAKEAAELFPALVLSGGPLGGLKALRPALGGDSAVRSASCCACSARSWLPACVACSAPVAPWLAPTSADICVRLVSILPTTPACTRMASCKPATEFCQRACALVDQRLVGWR